LWSDLTEINDAARTTVCVNNVVWHRDGGTAKENITTAFSRFAGIRDVVLIPSAVDLATRADARGLPAYVVDSASPFAHALAEVTRRILGESAPSIRGGLGIQLRENLRGKLRGVRLLG
jgi:Flp pilus assembly CpaE family ATPase